MTSKTTALLFGAAILHALSLTAQTTQGPTMIPQLNTDFYVGSVPGFYPSIQSAVTQLCALSSGPAANGSRVIVPAGSPATGTSGFTISAVTGGCVKVAIEDRRAIPPGAYLWTPTGPGSPAYLIQSAGGGATIAATPQNTHLIQPNAGSVANVAGPATTLVNAVDPIAQGKVNPDLFGTTNTGISAAQSAAICTSGCDIEMPATSTSTESVYTDVVVPQTHVTDKRFGQKADYYFNCFLAGSADVSYCEPHNFMNGPGGFTGGSYAIPVNDTFAVNGIYSNAGSVTNHTSIPYVGYKETRSIMQAHNTQFQANSVGDSGGHYWEMGVRGGEITASDESNVRENARLEENAPPAGTVSTGGANATLVVSSWSSHFPNLGDGHNVVDLSQVMDSGSLGAETLNTYPVANSIVVSPTSHPAISTTTTLSGACNLPNQTPRNSPLTLSCAVASTAGFTASTIISPTTDTICIGDAKNPEQVNYTIVDSTHFSLTMSYSHPSGISLFQHGGCGGKLFVRNGSVSASSLFTFTSYPIFGSTSTTNYVYGIALQQNQNGQQQIPVPSNSPTGIVSSTRVGTTVTLVTNGNAQIFNGITPPSGVTFSVSGSTDATINTTGQTSFSVVNNTITYTQPSGTGSSTGTGGVITLVGMNNYQIFCGAETIGIRNSTPLAANNTGHPWGDGGVFLEPNNCNWTVGDNIEQVNHYSQQFVNEEISTTAQTQASLPNVQFQSQMSGVAMNGTPHILQSTQTDSITDEVGYGGTKLHGHVSLHGIDYYDHMIAYDSYPLNGGAVLSIGGDPLDSSATPHPSSQTAYALAAMTASDGSQQKLLFDRVNKTLFFPTYQSPHYLVSNNGGTNGLVDYGAFFGLPAMYLFNNGAGTREGFGLQAFNEQNFVQAGVVISWNKGGDLQPNAGTNQLMQLDSTTDLVSLPSLPPSTSPICPNGATGLGGGGGFTTVGCSTPVASIPGATADFDFLQGSGTVLTDISGNGNTATLGASALAPTWTTTGLAFTGQENVSLPSALNASQTFLVGVYLTPLAPGNSFGVYGSNTFPTIASSSLDLAGLNLMYTPGPNYVAADQGDLAPGILSGSGTVTNCINRLSGWHVLGYVLGTSGTSVDHIYIDGNECNYSGSQGTSAGKQTSGNIFLGSSGTTNYSHSGLEGTMYRFVAFSSALTPAQILTFTGKINAEVSSRGVPLSQPAVPLASAQLTAIGDSITCGFQVGFACNHVTPWTGLLSLTNQPTYTINNWGVPGVYLSAILASDPNRIAQRCVSSNGPVNAVIFAGTNDLAAGTAGTTVAGVFGYLAAEIQVVKNAGCRVFVGTMISRTGTAAVGGTVDAAKDAYDALILTGAKAAGADGVIDFAADPLVGADNAYSNTTYFETAAVHPTLAGQQRLANAASNALNYYYGTSASAPHVVATTTYTMVSGDRFVQAAPTANAAYTMPDCTGPSGEVYTISNPQSAHTLTITGGASQPINGLSSAITIPSNSTVTLRDVANSKVASGCQWAM